jgi:hypothetical protein
MAAVTGIIHDITHISACVHDNKEMLTAIPMFSASGKKTRLQRRLPDVKISCELNVAYVNRKLKIN